jgi:hypothetical protein
VAAFLAAQSDMTIGSGIDGGVCATYIEPGYRNDITTVTFPATTTSPGDKYVYKHYGLQRQLGIVSQVADRELWKSGLLSQKETYNTQTYNAPSGQAVLVDIELCT